MARCGPESVSFDFARACRSTAIVFPQAKDAAKILEANLAAKKKAEPEAQAKPEAKAEPEAEAEAKEFVRTSSTAEEKAEAAAKAEEKAVVRTSSTVEEKAAKEAERIDNLWKRSEIPCHPC